MRPRAWEFVAAQENGLRAPLVLATITTPAGVRLYTSVGLNDAELSAIGGAFDRADGTHKADGTVQAGSQTTPLIGCEARVLAFGVMRDTGSILPTVAIRGRRGREVGNVECLFRNDDDYWGKLLAQDTILSATLDITVGYRGVRRDEFVTRFSGVIQEHTLTREQFSVRAESA